uniref:Katanin p80 WD40 repeat-containing subunit B1 homolog isoform X2 n=1 Tax=Rhizophora mucronata TaxID=61149 RepID=A0A2P2L2M4_RHIMU
MGWSTLGDLSINEGKLLGCSFYQNSVGVWVADTKLIEPYGAGFITEESDRTDRKFNIPTSQSLRETGTCVRLASAFRSMSPDYETKEIKNIYVDCKLSFLSLYEYKICHILVSLLANKFFFRIVWSPFTCSASKDLSGP